MTENYAVIVAGGAGLRMGSEIPKQFIEIAGMPILMHTLKQFFVFDPNILIILALPENQVAFWKNLCTQYEFQIPHKIAKGGTSRFLSVKNGLMAISGHEGIVAIHDGVRPLVPVEVIKNSFENATKRGSAVAAVKLKDSIRFKEKEGSLTKALNRNLFFLVQTPQTFQVNLIKKAFDTEERAEFSDDATVFEFYGEEVNLIEGSYKNIKITTPEDLIIARVFLENRIDT